MNATRMIGCILCMLLAAQAIPASFRTEADPVLKARTERAQAQGISEADLPQVPRGVTDPPPLPPPEVHRRDSRGAGAARTARAKTRAKSGRKKARTPKSAIRRSVKKSRKGTR